MTSLRAIAVLFAIALAGCGTVTTRKSPAPAARAPDTAPAPTQPAVPRGGGYYLDDGPGDNPPPDLERVPDAVPKLEPLRRGTMRPYTVMGQSYTPMTRLAPYTARGIASWYGRRYHGQQTASGEIYDMYAMTAAHTTLPIPSYARVTNLANNKSVVVRINDRGPFHSDRLIDLSYTAAYRLGVLGGGKALVEVETIIPDAGTPIPPTVAAPPAAPTATLSSPAEPSGTPREEPVSSVIARQESVAMQPEATVTGEPKEVFLQFGAFGAQDNADSYLARLRTQIGWLAPVLHVYPKDGLFRVHAGPYATQAEARAAADRIDRALGIKATVFTR